jgi:hypothetical protein
MARYYADRVAFTSATIGTGNLALGAAISDAFLAPSESDIVDGDNPFLLIQEGDDFEITDATYVDSGPHFTRDTVIVSKIGGVVGTSKMDLGGAEIVRLVTPALFWSEILSQILMLLPIDLTTDVTGDLPFASLAQGSALSVLGVTGNATADNASIAAVTDHQVMRRSGTAVAFGAVNLAQSAAVTGTLPAANLPAATTTSIGAVEEAIATEVYASTADKYLHAGHLSTGLTAVAITNQTPATWAWTDGIYFTLTISQNTQIANPSGTEVPGQTRFIYVVGNDTTDRTITFGNQFFDVPTITDCDSGQPYLLVITCLTTDKFTVSARKGW